MESFAYYKAGQLMGKAPAVAAYSTNVFYRFSRMDLITNLGLWNCVMS